jgi:predicted nucleic acid-binding protein
MGRLLLDTTVIIDALRGRPVVERLRGLRDAGDSPWVCAVTIEEVARGLRGPRESEAARRLFSGLQVVALGAREGWRAGIWRQQHANIGITLGQADCLIAAAAVTIGGRLATGNPRDYPMEGIAVEHWPVGS